MLVMREVCSGPSLSPPDLSHVDTLPFNHPPSTREKLRILTAHRFQQQKSTLKRVIIIKKIRKKTPQLWCPRGDNEGTASLARGASAPQMNTPG